LADEPQRRWRALDATVVFVDISGFTRLSERLAKRGRVGAEELSDVIGSCFSELLAVAYAEDGALLKFGGDALLILFTGDDHAARGSRAAVGMRSRLREIGGVQTPGGRVRLRMSVGVHTAEFLAFLVGGSHRELVITGPAASTVVTMEGTAEAGEIVVSPATAARLPAASLGDQKGPGVLLRRAPGTPGDAEARLTDPTGADLAIAVPAGLRDFLRAGGDDPEHRIATVAFVHFDGVDEIVERDGPEQLAAALDELLDDAAAAALEHDVTFLGTDVDHDGGKIILATGIPRAARQDEERMLRALRRIVERERVLPVRIGVNRGHVFAGEIGPWYRRTYTVMGDTVNLAARVMAKAVPGQVLATGGVLEQAHSPFATEELEPFYVKGKSRPVHAFAVGAPRPVSGDQGGAPVTLVGRDTELKILHEAIDAAREKSGSVVELRGGTGIGKSRLADETARAATGLERFRIGCVPYESANPYWAFRELARQIMQVPDGAPATYVERRLQECVGRSAPELAVWLPLLAAPLQLDVAETADTASLEPQFRRQRIEEVNAAFLAAMLPSPTLVIIEDAHWMDEASIGVLRQVEAGIGAGPWFLLLTRDDDTAGFHASGPASHVLGLAPLSAAHAAELLRHATEDEPLRPHEVEVLVERAGGNPRFLVELAREVALAGETKGLPDTIDSLLSAQIDRLPDAARRDLRYAAVLGHAFDAQLLAAVVDDPDDALNAGLRGMLVADRRGRLRFQNALLRDVAYEGLRYQTRRALHQRVASQLEAATDRRDENAALLSLHCFHGDLYAKAWEYSRIAADRAQANYANVEAAELLERALASARRCDEVGAVEVAGVAEQLGDVREQMGVYDRAREAYHTARKLRGDDALYEARLCLKQASIADRLGDYSQAVRWVQRGLRGLDDLGSVDADTAAGVAAFRARLTAWFGGIRLGQGRQREAIRLCESAIDLARAGGVPDALAHAQSMLDCAYLDLGRLDLATNAVEALTIYEELGDLGGEARVANNLGQAAYYGGRWDDALALTRRAEAARMRTGNVVEAAIASANCAEIAMERGHYAEAEELLVDARRVFRSAREREFLAFANSLLGRIAARQGRPAEAFTLLEEAREDYVATGGGFDVQQVEAWMAEAAVFAGNPQAAIERIDRTIALTRAGGEIGLLGPALYRALGYARGQLGEFAAARLALDDSLAHGREQTQDYEIALTLVARGRLEAWAGTSGDPEADREAAAILERLGVDLVPDVPRQPVSN
jgi:class 3 adenylate cyclase/tetratricopeptide (TPR) repeat protein